MERAIICTASGIELEIQAAGRFGVWDALAHRPANSLASMQGKGHVFWPEACMGFFLEILGMAENGIIALRNKGIFS